MPTYPDPSELDGNLEYALSPLSIYRSPRNDYVSRVYSTLGELILEWDGKVIEDPAACLSYSLTPEKWYFELVCCTGVIKLSLFRTWKKSTRWVSDIQVWTFAPGYKFGIPDYAIVPRGDHYNCGYEWSYYLLDNSALYYYLADQLSGYELSETWEWFLSYLDPDNLLEGWSKLFCPSLCPIEGNPDPLISSDPTVIFTTTWGGLITGLSALGFSYQPYASLSYETTNVTNGDKIAYYQGNDPESSSVILTVDDQCSLAQYTKFRLDCDEYGYIYSNILSSDCLSFDCSSSSDIHIPPYTSYGSAMYYYLMVRRVDNWQQDYYGASWYELEGAHFWLGYATDMPSSASGLRGISTFVKGPEFQNRETIYIVHAIYGSTLDNSTVRLLTTYWYPYWDVQTSSLIPAAFRYPVEEITYDFHIGAIDEGQYSVEGWHDPKICSISIGKPSGSVLSALDYIEDYPFEENNPPPPPEHPEGDGKLVRLELTFRMGLEVRGEFIGVKINTINSEPVCSSVTNLELFAFNWVLDKLLPGDSFIDIKWVVVGSC